MYHIQMRHLSALLKKSRLFVQDIGEARLEDKKPHWGKGLWSSLLDRQEEPSKIEAKSCLLNWLQDIFASHNANETLSLP